MKRKLEFPIIPKKLPPEVLSEFWSVFLNKNEEEIMDSIESVITNYGKDAFLNSTKKNSIIVSLTSDGVTSPAKFNILFYAIGRQYTKVIKKLLEIGFDLERHMTSENSKFDKLSPYQFSIITGSSNAEVMSLLLLNQQDFCRVFPFVLGKPKEITDLLEDAIAPLLMSITLREAGKMELIDHVLILAKERNRLHDLLSIKNKYGYNLLESFACSKNHYVVKKLMEIDNWQSYCNVPKLLELLRLASWTYPEYHTVFNEFCLRVRNSKTQRTAVILDNAHYFTMEKAYRYLFGSEYETGKEKNQALKRMMTQALVLLDCAVLSITYLTFLDKELIRYYQEAYHTQYPELNQNDYEFKVIDGLFYPIPNEHYQGLHKHNALDKLLIAKFKQYDLAQQAYQWLGFIPKKTSLKMLIDGDYVKESKYGSGLFHGTLSHMLQAIILIYAIENEEIDLSYELDGEKKSLSIKAFLSAFLEIKEDDSKFIWTSIRDRRAFDRVSFCDPHRLGSFIMHEGKKHGLNALSTSLTDSFCKKFNKVLAGYNSILPSIPMDNNTFVDQMNDIISEDFQISDNLFQYAVIEVMQKAKVDLESIICGKKYAAIPLKYTQDNPSFEAAYFVNQPQMTHMYFAAKYNALSMVKILVDMGKDPDEVSANPEGHTALTVAASNRNCLILEYLTNHTKANKDASDEAGRTALYYSVLRSADEQVQFLLEKGANPNLGRHDKNGNPLAIAIQYNKNIAFDLLLKYKADVNHTLSAHIRTLLNLVSAFQRDSFHQFIKQYSQTDYIAHFTPLQLAVVCGHRYMVEELLKAGASMKVNENNIDLIALARCLGHSKIESILIQKHESSLQIVPYVVPNQNNPLRFFSCNKNEQATISSELTHSHVMGH